LKGIEDERIRPIFQEHQGAQVARNVGQQAAQGRAIKHLDDDDYLVPGELVREYRTLRESGVDVCYADFHKLDEFSDESWVHTNMSHQEVDGDFFTALVSRSVNRLQLAILFDAGAIADVSWDESLEYLQDVNFMLRAATQGLSCVKVERVVAVHRMHEGARISDVRRSAAKERRLSMQARWFDQAFRQLANRDNLTDARRKAVAKGLWQMGHMLAPYDWESGYRWLQRAPEIDKGISPERSSAILGMLDWFLSPLSTERLTASLRRYRLSLQE